MRFVGVKLALVAASSLVVSLSHAVPAPMSEAELEKNADTVVEGEAMFVVCNGVAKQDNVRIQQYVSTIKPHKWLKGARVDSLAVHGAIAIDPLPPGNVPSAPLPRGWRGKLYLVKSAKNVYGLAFYNGAVEDKRSSVPSDLPRCSESELPPVSVAPSASAEPDAAAAPSREPVKRESSGCGGCATLGAASNDGIVIVLAALALLASFRRVDP